MSVERPIHLAVVGGSGSGKTWLVDALATALAPQATRICLDDFYRDLSHLSLAERNRVNFDDPAMIDWETLRGVMERLDRNEEAALPSYDFSTHSRKREARPLAPTRLMVWDGLWLMHPEWLRVRFTASFFVECPTQTRFERRLARDVRERGRSPESVRRQFFDDVEPMHAQFVEPQRQWVKQVVASPLQPGEFEKLLRELKAMGL